MCKQCALRRNHSSNFEFWPSPGLEIRSRKLSPDTGQRLPGSPAITTDTGALCCQPALDIVFWEHLRKATLSYGVEQVKCLKCIFDLRYFPCTMGSSGRNTVLHGGTSLLAFLKQKMRHVFACPVGTYLQFSGKNIDLGENSPCSQFTYLEGGWPKCTLASGIEMSPSLGQLIPSSWTLRLGEEWVWNLNRATAHKTSNSYVTLSYD